MLAIVNQSDSTQDNINMSQKDSRGEMLFINSAVQK